MNKFIEIQYNGIDVRCYYTHEHVIHPEYIEWDEDYEFTSSELSEIKYLAQKELNEYLEKQKSEYKDWQDTMESLNQQF